MRRFITCLALAVFSVAPAFAQIYRTDLNPPAVAPQNQVQWVEDACQSPDVQGHVINSGSNWIALTTPTCVPDPSTFRTSLGLGTAATQPTSAFAASSHTHAQSDVTGLTTALAGKANTSHTHAQSDVTNLTSDLALKAPLASPALTGIPTAPTATAGNSSTLIATTAFVSNAVAAGGFSLNPTPSTPSRTVNSNFTPSSTKAVLVSYSLSLQITNPLLAGSSTADVELRSDSAGTPTTVRAKCTAVSGVGIAVAIQIAQTNPCVLTYMVPAGQNVRLVTSTSGTASVSMIAQTEETLG